jgi:hypothetical protein
MLRFAKPWCIFDGLSPNLLLQRLLAQAAETTLRVPTMVEPEKNQWRARLQFKIGGVRTSVRGPCRDEQESARGDLEVLLRAKASNSDDQAAYGIVASVASGLKARVAARTRTASTAQGSICLDADFPDQKAEVERLARQLAEAMQNGNRAAVSDLLSSFLSHPASLDDGFVSGRTLLAEAVRFNCQDVVETLLEHGADPNAACSSGLAPLHLAAMNGKLSLMHSLLLWGADPCLGDGAGLTPLQKAIVTAPNATLDHARELLLLCGGRESAADQRRLAIRLLADKNDAAYLARFRGDAVAPPASGVASHLM